VAGATTVAAAVAETQIQSRQRYCDDFVVVPLVRKG
jgi:hypothetical protein